MGKSRRWDQVAGAFIGRAALLVSLASLGSLSACRPSTVAEAEARGDVAWLQQQDSAEAVAALGRLADRAPAAVTALTQRSAYDVQAFAAAWNAVQRNAAWGTTLLRSGLADPKRADVAASAMTTQRSLLRPFVPDLEGALVRLSSTQQNVNVASGLAAAGPEARAAIERRLDDTTTRNAMCLGIASPRADADARAALLAAPEAGRNARACVDAVVQLANDDDPTLTWVAEVGEPGLLGAASKSDALGCPRVHVAWVKAFAARSADAYPALTVPLGYAVHRCAAQMDGILADAITHKPSAHGVIVQAIDPFAGYIDGLRATCAALPLVVGGRGSPVVRERASDALMHACRAPG